MQRDRDELDDLVEAARSRGPQERFQLRERVRNAEGPSGPRLQPFRVRYGEETPL